MQITPIMKKLILTGIACLLTALCAAQTPEEKALFDQDRAITEKLIEAVNAKDYAAAEKCCQEQMRLFQAQSADIKQKYAYFLQGCHYNLACMQSLQNKRKPAVKNFALACENGYDDYNKVRTDTDLDNIRGDKTFRRLHEAMRATSDYLHILQTASGYTSGKACDTLPAFTYMSPNNRELVRVRVYFKLDSVAGSGDELSKIQRILTYVHDRIRHDGSRENPQPMSAIALAEACKDGSRGLNCRGLATVLNECYLAMGFKSRLVTCMPKVYINDCHAINTVYSATLDKWVWVDPTNNAWVMDERGTMLSIAEVRERLCDGRELVLNQTANWNNRSQTRKEEYLDSYMAKNLYCIYCSDRSEFATEVWEEGEKRPKYTFLCPEGFTPNYPYSRVDYTTTDAGWFWQSPYNE